MKRRIQAGLMLVVIILSSGILFAAPTSPPEVQSVAPTTLDRATDVTVMLLGSGFCNSSTSVVAGDCYASEVLVYAGSLIVASFEELPQGSLNLTVETPNGAATVPGAIDVTSGPRPPKVEELKRVVTRAGNQLGEVLLAFVMFSGTQVLLGTEAVRILPTQEALLVLRSLQDELDAVAEKSKEISGAIVFDARKRVLQLSKEGWLRQAQGYFMGRLGKMQGQQFGLIARIAEVQSENLNRVVSYALEANYFANEVLSEKIEKVMKLLEKLNEKVKDSYDLFALGTVSLHAYRGAALVAAYIEANPVKEKAYQEIFDTLLKELREAWQTYHDSEKKDKDFGKFEKACEEAWKEFKKALEEEKEKED